MEYKLVVLTVLGSLFYHYTIFKKKNYLYVDSNYLYYYLYAGFLNIWNFQTSKIKEIICLYRHKETI